MGKSPHVAVTSVPTWPFALLLLVLLVWGSGRMALSRTFFIPELSLSQEHGIEADVPSKEGEKPERGWGDVY